MYQICYDSEVYSSDKEMWVENSKPGYRYFGARYYDPDLSVWLSVDPLASKYPSMSPYMYCAGNPVILVDPDGRSSMPPPWLVSHAVFLTSLYFGYDDWYSKTSDASTRLLLNSSGYIPPEADVPQSVREQASTLATINDATTVLKAAVDVAETAGSVLGSIPGVETVGDAVGLFYNIAQNDVEGIATYSLALAIPGVSANLVKLSSKGVKLVNKMLKYSTDGRIPLPMVDGELQKGFIKLKGTQGYVHEKTGIIFRKSNSLDGSKTNTQWKAYSKGTTDFKKSENRVTIEGDGSLIGN